MSANFSKLGPNLFIKIPRSIYRQRTSGKLSHRSVVISEVSGLGPPSLVITKIVFLRYAETHFAAHIGEALYPLGCRSLSLS